MQSPMTDALKPNPDGRWRLDEHGYEPALEHEVESRFTVANGLLGVRGSMEIPTMASRPRTFVAGLFDGGDGTPPVPSLVSAPDWLHLRLLANREALSLEAGELLEYARSLDFRRGVLITNLRHKTAAGVVVSLRTLRFVSLSERHIAAQVATIQVDRAAHLQLEALMEEAPGPLKLLNGDAGFALFQLDERALFLAVSGETELRIGGTALRPEGREPRRLRWSWEAEPEESATLIRLVTFAKGGSAAVTESQARAGIAERDAATTVRRLYREHVRAWERRWSASDVAVEGDEASQRALRFAAYHLTSAANPEDERVSVGARALTGEGYKGHVFWDTETFLLPFYILTWPAAARALLMYRYHTLPAARAKAEGLGFRGALYAWESADTGEETTPPFALGPQGQIIPILSGIQEHHISADIAYAVWQYWQATRDTSFLLEAGAEILFETSRFWASRARLEEDGRYHIREVIGPDEYHDSVDDNAYTNVMAAFNLECGRSAARLLSRRWPDRWTALSRRLGLSSEELAEWEQVSDKLATGFDEKSGLIEQFAGFFDLEQVDLAAFADRTAPMDVVLGPERTRHSQVIKQADVVMLLALLPERFPFGVQQANFHYYEPRTGHGSSLSPSVHALVAARLGDTVLAKRLFDEAAAIDLDDTMGNAAAGVHIGALGGLWQAAIFGFAGLYLEDNGLRFDPHLPAGWGTLRFPVQWRGSAVRVEIGREPLTLRVTLEHGAPISVSVGGLRRRLRREEVWECLQTRAARWEEVVQ